MSSILPIPVPLLALLLCSPLTADSISQAAYLKASNTEADDRFGVSVAATDERIVVGAWMEDSSATGVNGNGGDNGAAWSGAAYVFARSGGSWHFEAYLKASNTEYRDRFGHSVAIAGDTIVVGAAWEDSSATGVNGDQADNGAEDSGAVYVFRRSGTTWSQEAYLKASNTDPEDLFGGMVALSGDTLVVGAGSEDSSATGVNGDQADNGAEDSGAVYVFTRTGTRWSQQAYLKASNTEAEDHFVLAAISRNTILVGAPGEDSGATGVNGDETDNTEWNSGAAYVFVRNGTTWSQEAYLKASNTDGAVGPYFGDTFGYAVSVSQDTAVVGAYREASAATGVNGDQSDNSASHAGAAYVFFRSGTSWSQEAYLKASNTEEADLFGKSVTVSGDTIVVGAPFEDSDTDGVNGDQHSNDALNSGAAYLFVRTPVGWSQQAYLKASNSDRFDGFGSAVTLADDTVAVGARGEASGATGVNGDQGDNNSPEAGAAYAFRVQSPGVGYCFGDPGSGTPCPCSNDNDGSVPGSGCANGAFPSGARLTGSGTASFTGDTLILAASGLPPNDTGLYFQGNNELAGGDGLAFGDGLRCAGGGLIRLQVRFSDASGASSTTIAVGTKGGVSPGDTKRYQCWYRDNSGGQPCGVGVNDFNLSNGYEIAWLP